METTVGSTLAAPAPSRAPWAMLPARTILFALTQALFALLLAGSWDASVRWWPLSLAAANVVNLVLLVRLARAEGRSFWSLTNADRRTWKRDLLWLAGALVLAGPVSYLPNVALATALFGSLEAAGDLMFLPLPYWAALLAVPLVPLTIALTELTTYYGYVMPRLQAQLGRRWWIPVLVALWHAAQHATLPLIFDAPFVLWRLGMFVPFALLVAVLVNRRPTLLPYLMVVHGLLDLSLPLMILARSAGQ